MLRDARTTQTLVSLLFLATQNLTLDGFSYLDDLTVAVPMGDDWAECDSARTFEMQGVRTHQKATTGDRGLVGAGRMVPYSSENGDVDFDSGGVDPVFREGDTTLMATFAKRCHDKIMGAPTLHYCKV